MVNWKSIENQQRLVATLLAANPGLKLDYPRMAAIFGQGATYDTIEYQFRKYRRQAEELKREAARQGVSLSEIPRGRASEPVSTSTTPRTPRTGGRGGVIKPSSSTGKGKGLGLASTPTKRRSKKDTSGSLIEAIYVDDDDDDDCCGEEDSSGVKIKSEGTSSSVLSSIEPSVFGLADRIKTDRQSEDRDFKVHSDNCSTAASRATSRTVREQIRALQRDVDGDEEVVATPVFDRTTREGAPTRSLSLSRGDAGYETDTTDGVA
ncbi:hypothetical protein ASPCAL07242 [Aspergillus calidoustus]|uniref:Uncharacterized protein n=1 Tax=Aspergillus calidoustus TaxID=454130 RepID=A0A0U4Z8Q0_ASPCI|nr:hypothetical protein ASPCAL07242 [Aspergillus calidoustus]